MTLIKKIANYIWSKNFLLNFSAIILVYIIGMWLFKSCLDYRTNHGQKIEVPNLLGKNQNNLKNILANSNLGYEVLDSLYEPSKVEGTILEQDPEPTSKSGVFVKEGRVVKVRVSKRTQLVEMPNLVDKSQRFAESILINREFRYKLEYKPSREAHGAVLAQLFKGKSIAPGTKIPIGSVIKLIVGRDEAGEALLLPNLYGLTLVEAKERVLNMQNMEFLAVCPTCLTSSDSLSARVQSQSPEFEEGVMVASGTTISVFATKESTETPR